MIVKCSYCLINCIWMKDTPPWIAWILPEGWKVRRKEHYSEFRCPDCEKKGIGNDREA